MDYVYDIKNSNENMVVLRADYYILCEGDQCAAMMLNEFKGQCSDKWMETTQEELKDDLYSMFGVKRISRSLSLLVKNGYLLRRKNPRCKWSKTYQYKVNLKKIESDLKKQIKDPKNSKGGIKNIRS